MLNLEFARNDASARAELNQKLGERARATGMIGIDYGTDDHTMIPVRVEPGYHDLAAILIAALQQAQNGKGSERHANGQAFKDQPILTIARQHGMGFPMGQAQKKIIEAAGMLKRGDRKAAEREMLGAINYLAAAVIRLHEMEGEN